jgi:hypothetical protein
MTTHPPGHPPGPTGPGRDQWLDANTGRWPTYLEVLADVGRLLDQALAILERPINPQSYPQGSLGHVADAGFEVVGFNLESVGRELKKMRDLAKPCTQGLPEGPCALPQGHTELHWARP